MHIEEDNEDVPQVPAWKCSLQAHLLSMDYAQIIALRGHKKKKKNK